MVMVNFAGGYCPWPINYLCRSLALRASFPIGLRVFFRFGFYSDTLELAQIEIQYCAPLIAEITLESPVIKQLMITSQLNSFLIF
jgi:hypothetical protein